MTPSSSHRERVAPERAQAPIRWSRPDAASVALVLLWAGGVVLALLVPAVIVSPSTVTAPHADVWKAFTASIVGSAVMIGAAFGLWLRRRDAAVLLMGAVPAFSCIVGGVVLTAAKLTGT